MDADRTGDVIGKAHPEVGVATGEGHRDDVAEGGLIDLHRRDVRDAGELDFAVVIDLVGQLADAVIDFRDDDFLFRIAVAKDLEQAHFSVVDPLFAKCFHFEFHSVKPPFSALTFKNYGAVNYKM